MLSLRTLTWLLAAALLSLHPSVSAHNIDRFRQDHQMREEQKIQPRSLKESVKDNSTSSLGAEIAQCNSPSCYRFYNPKTAPYFIISWPDVEFETGEFYSGSIPIDENDPSRTLFFIFKPKHGVPAEFPDVEEVTIWLNGGPGCR